MDYKDLKKLAAACRAAGIKSYKCKDFEFELSPDGPVSNYKKRQAKETVSAEESVIDHTFKTDELTQDALLFWSSGASLEENNESL